MLLSPPKQQQGAVIVFVAVALVALLGVAALTVDVGRLAGAAQTAQDVADAAAFGGGQELPDYDQARFVAVSLVAANNESGGGFEAACSPDDGDVVFWGPYDEVPDFGSLGSAAWAMRVTAHVPVDYVFARAVGLTGATMTRSCTMVLMPVGGTSIAPMWVSYGTDYAYGQEQELIMADGPHYANMPGNFGWLTPPSGDGSSFLELLRGYDLTYQQILDNWVTTDGAVYGYPGVNVGQWRKALDESNDGLARMQRALWEPWAGDTLDNFHDDNPRILIVPLVEYLGGTGSNAEFRIDAFGAFWIESINGQKKPYSITGRFIQYVKPGAGGNALAPETGLWTVKPVS